MRRPVLHLVLSTMVRAVLLALLPAFALPLVAWSSAAVPADLTTVDLAPASLVSAPPSGEAAGEGQVLPGHTSARQAPAERLTGSAPPPPDEPPLRQAAPAPLPTLVLPPGPGPDDAPTRTSDHEPTLGRAPPSVTST